MVSMGPGKHSSPLARGRRPDLDWPCMPARTRLPSAKALLAAALAIAGSGCSGTVVVEDTFPAPLVEKLPLRVAVYYPPALTDFTYTEEAEGDREWTVRLGAANIRMFDAVFTGLFPVTQRVSEVSAAATEMPGHQAMVAPSVDAFEFSLPGQSSTDQYAVWIRYNLDVYDREGNRVLRWPVSAYGQSGTGGLSDEESMERAAVLALRDAAAAIAVGFARQPGIREKLLEEVTHEDP